MGVLRSMTGYGEAVAENESFRIKAAIKAVNQRYLDITLHAPAQLTPLEVKLRQAVKARVARGKIDLFLTLTDKREGSASVRCNRQLASAYQQALNELSDYLHVARPDDVQEIAAYPDVLQVEADVSLTGCEPVLMEAVAGALRGLDEMRCREGEALAADFRERLTLLTALREQLEQLAPEIVAAYRARLEQMLGELLAAQDIDESRIIQETALYADKVNYTEETVRLGSHFAQFSSIIETADGPVGRKLDFLIQEMNREANTIGSKCNSAKAAQLVVDLKSEIEKLREQVQNIE